MCELLGTNHAPVVACRAVLRAFQRRSRANPDGWGVGYYTGNRLARVVKEPRAALFSRLAERFRRNEPMHSHIAVAHIRRATRGRIDYCNTHPFVRRYAGKDWIFAHNGTIRDLGPAQLNGPRRPFGETDSEALFCMLLNRMEREGRRLETEADFTWLAGIFAEINERGQFNALLADGDRLFAYFDARGHNGLCWRRDEVPLPDAMGGDRSRGSGVIIASLPLDDTRWNPFPFGTLMVFRGGRLEYSSRPVPPPEAYETSAETGRIVSLLAEAPEGLKFGRLLEALHDRRDGWEEIVHGLLCLGILECDRTGDRKWNDTRTVYRLKEPAAGFRRRIGPGAANRQEFR